MARKKSTHRKTKTTKGWSARAPKTQKQRKALLARCGPSAFLQPKQLKYPVMAATGPCVIDCRGVRAAKSRAGQYRHPGLEKKADKVAKKSVCTWER